MPPSGGNGWLRMGRGPIWEHRNTTPTCEHLAGGCNKLVSAKAIARMTREKTAMKSAEEEFRQESVRSLGESEPVTVSRTATLGEALDKLRVSDSGGCVIVVDDVCGQQKPVGIITERDYLDRIVQQVDAGADEALAAPVEDYMTAGPKTLSENADLEKAIQLMTTGRGYRHLPLVDDNGLLTGLILTRDIIAFLAQSFPVEVMNLPPQLHQDERIDSREGG